MKIFGKKKTVTTVQVQTTTSTTMNDTEHMQDAPAAPSLGLQDPPRKEGEKRIYNLIIFDLERFIKAQDNCGSYATALQELRDGWKQTHWIWYVFPQMRGLGHSAFSNMYGIASLLEAKAYLENTVLSDRIREAVDAILDHTGESVEGILGSLDAKKFQSSMTLFDIVCPDDVFARALDEFFGGRRCRRTIDMTSDELSNYTGPTALEKVTGRVFDQKAFFEVASHEAKQISMMGRTTHFLNCVRKGHSMRRMVERYLWDRDLSAYRCTGVEMTLRECLMSFPSDCRRLRYDETLNRAVKSAIEAIGPGDVFLVADAFDKFVADCMRHPVLGPAMIEYIESY